MNNKRKNIKDFTEQKSDKSSESDLVKGFRQPTVVLSILVSFNAKNIHEIPSR